MKKIYSSMAATTMMTAFSYFFSYVSGKNLKEPHILSQLAGRLMPLRPRKKNIITGWILHYAVGLLFTEMYLRFWERSPYRNEMKNGLVYGGIAGIATILIWRCTFYFHLYPPAVNFALYSVNLFLCHVFFGIVSSFTLP